MNEIEKALTDLDGASYMDAPLRARVEALPDEKRRELVERLEAEASRRMNISNVRTASNYTE